MRQDALTVPAVVGGHRTTSIALVVTLTEDTKSIDWFCRFFFWLTLDEIDVGRIFNQRVAVMKSDCWKGPFRTALKMAFEQILETEYHGN